MLAARLVSACLVSACLLATAPVAADPKMTDALNQYRAAAGVRSVSYSRVLEKAAAAHAQDMLRARFFSHRGSDGSTASKRVSRTGYNWCFVAENIAQGQRSLGAVMKAWYASPGHRANMLSGEVTEFALVAEDGYIWVMVLARPGC